MKLIDTSAWIQFFRAKGDPVIKSKVADMMNLGHASYTCPVRFELFLGAKQEELPDLTEGLNFAKRLPLTSVHWDTAADLGRSLRKKGITLPVSDLLIAVVAAQQKVPLIACDEHFEIIRNKILPSLQLA